VRLGWACWEVHLPLGRRAVVIRGQCVSKTLVIVPCGARKIWDVQPHRGPTAARDAYIGTPFKVNRGFAEVVGDRWVILSAKYGFIEPDFVITGPYNVTFNRKASRPVTVEYLRQQISELGLDQCKCVVVLGGQAYREIVEAAFRGLGVQLCFPFAGLPLGKALQATKQAALAFRELVSATKASTFRESQRVSPVKTEIEGDTP